MDVSTVLIVVFYLGLWVYAMERERIRKETVWLAARGLPMPCGKTNNCRLAGGCKACYQRLLPKPKLDWPTYIR